MRISSGLLQEIIRKENTQMHIVLHEPEIPGNTGNIGRSCAATNTSLHLIEPLGFYITEKELRRAGMDYWSQLDVHRYRDYEDFLLENFGTISPRQAQQDGLEGFGLEDRRRTENKIVTPAAQLLIKISHVLRVFGTPRPRRSVSTAKRISGPTTISCSARRAQVFPKRSLWITKIAASAFQWDSISAL